MAKELVSLIDFCKTQGLSAKNATLGMLAILWAKDPELCQTHNIIGNDALNGWFNEHPTQLNFFTNCTLEEQAYFSSTLYANLLEKLELSTLCTFFTPPFLANRLIKQIKGQNLEKFKSGNIADLSAGGGAFLLPTAIHLLKCWSSESPREQLKKLESSLIGVDICQDLLELCAVYLYRLCSDLINASGYIPKWKLYCKNTLDVEFIGDVDIVLCNPPYRKLTKIEHKKYKPNFHYVMNANSNLYALFIQQAINLSKNDALIGYVTPASLLTGAHFRNARDFITRNAKVKSIDLMEGRNKYFSFVLQETILFSIDKGKDASCKTKLYEINSSGGEKRLGNIDIFKGKDEWICYRSNQQRDLVKLIRKQKYDLNSLGFKVNIGGYVWNRDLSEKQTKSLCDPLYFPVIYPEMIKASGVKLDCFKENKNKNKARWIKPRSIGLLKRVPSLVLKRTRTSCGAHILSTALIDLAFIDKYHAYVPENHVIYITRDDNSLQALSALEKLLSMEVISNLHACVNSTNSVSKSSLLNIPMPSPEVFEKLIVNSISDNELIKELY
jgi:adenine-specific DNA-methyltransferase